MVVPPVSAVEMLLLPSRIHDDEQFAAADKLPMATASGSMATASGNAAEATPSDKG